MVLARMGRPRRVTWSASCSVVSCMLSRSAFRFSMRRFPVGPSSFARLGREVPPTSFSPMTVVCTPKLDNTSQRLDHSFNGAQAPIYVILHYQDRRMQVATQLVPTAARRWLTTDDVAARYRTVPGTVRYWRHVGYGPKAVKIGRRMLYSEVELQRFEDALWQSAA
ncbi:helix-turn-helix domain-containing protein [Streptomyces sp. NPDC050535]|uniref:helix-turn-helix domain-containing protein n=1 Tax=Streptomyces sp. NPDC050535 TaxID=3365626 RepID=UPI00379F5A6E